MEVFHSAGEEGVLTICLDGNETVKLPFKKKVQVSVTYATDTLKGTVVDNPNVLKKEALPTEIDEEKKRDSLDEELNGIIERVKNDESGNDGLFSSAGEDLFAEGIGSKPQKMLSKDSNCDSNKINKGKDGNPLMEHFDDGDDFESAMDIRSEDFEVHADENDNESLNAFVDTNGMTDKDSTGERGNKTKNARENRQDNDAIISDESIIDEVASSDKISEKKTAKDFDKKRIFDSEKKSDISHKDDDFSKLVREVAEKRINIGQKRPVVASMKDKGFVKDNGKLKRATVFKCNLCEKTFSDSYLLSMHQRAENSKVKCKTCNLECISKANLIIHEHLMHSKTGRISGKRCPVCEKSFEKHSDILSHIRSEHTKEGLYRCCVCSAIFQSYQSFKSHLDAHDKERLLREAKKRGDRKRIHQSLAELSKVQQLTSGVGKGTPKAGHPTSSASKRKSQKPVQHLSLMNFQPPAKSPKIVKATIPSTSKPTLPPKPSRHGVPSRAPSTPSVRVVKTSPAKPGSTISTSKTIVKHSSSSKLVSPPIKKEVLASRLKPMTSLLLNRKRSLNQMSGNIAKSMPRVILSRGPLNLKTLPRVSAGTRALLAKRGSIIKGQRAADKLWKCHFCERVFRTKGEYINHKKPSRITNMCKECGFTSTSEALYIIHQYQKHTNRGNDRYTAVNKDLRCHICEESISLNEVLNHVMVKHTKEHPYECCVCKKPTRVYEDWVSHGKSHIRSKEEKSNLSKSKLVLNFTVKTEETVQNNNLFCNLCKQYFSNEKEFIRHHRSETEGKECEVCRQTCYTKAGYLIHKYISHGLAVGDTKESCTIIPSSLSGNFKSWHEDDPENEESSESSKCPGCHEDFPMKDLMNHVMDIHTQELQYKCCTCKAAISTLDQYIDHCNFHLGRKLYTRGTQRCLVCGLRFESRIRLSRHKIMHKPTCSFCPMEFSSKALLDVHLKNVHTNEMTACGFCGKLFADSGQLAEHERNHFFYKKSPCPVCGINVVNVNKHMARVHPKPDTQFLCSLCGKKFALRCDHQRHMMRHSNDRKHECDICKKTFKRAGGLRRHAQSHLQDRKFHECHICGKKCSQRNNLSVHMRVHSSTKAFTCEHCGQGFNYNQSLQTHIRKKHTHEAPNTTTASSAVAPPSPEPAVVNIRNPKPEPVVPKPEPINQIVNNISSQPSMIPIPPSNYHQHPGYQPAEASQHYYPDPGTYIPVIPTAFQQRYNDLISTIEQSDHGNNPHQTAQPQNYQVYYPQL